ncbi:hypothetical protein DPMN_175884 [Dreissena polymorpha]|uniref:Uncharacterized protein n=1 Tax=Dreissena polymorpha TaxID=45954 RepID=A0A9D4IJ61_DREPO|nr:hypothetical protein DPMN_175884 [Dreissena polymorpha]
MQYEARGPNRTDQFCTAQYIIRTNILTNFNKDWTINVTFRVKNALPPDAHFHQEQTINMASRVLKTGFYYSNIYPYIKEKCPAPSRPYIIGTNLLTKFHDVWTINVATRVLTILKRKNAQPPDGHVF